MISAGINTGVEMAAQAATDAAPDRVRAICDRLDALLPDIVNTAMDAATAALPIDDARNIGAAVAVGAAGAIAAGASLGKVRHTMYRAGSVLGDAEAIASGNPQRVVRRIGQHIFWRAFGRAGRALFKGIFR